MEIIGVLIVAAGLGMIPGLIAKNKGYSFGTWWFYGFLIFIVALPHSLMLSPYAGSDFKKCPFCAEMIRADAIKCKHCGSSMDSKKGNYIPDKPIPKEEVVFGKTEGGLSVLGYIGTSMGILMILIYFIAFAMGVDSPLFLLFFGIACSVLSFFFARRG
jgi:hypothetical protein